MFTKYTVTDTHTGQQRRGTAEDFMQGLGALCLVIVVCGLMFWVGSQ